MYWSFKKTNFLALLMIFSALTYFSQTYSSDYRLIARDERSGGGERFQGGQGDRGRQGGESRQYQGTYHPGQSGGEGEYKDYGHSYSSQSRAAGAYGAGAMRGYNQGEENQEGNTQYVPVNPYEQQQPSSQPQQTYPYYQQPY